MDDHISKALARAQENADGKGSDKAGNPSVRDWVRPEKRARQKPPSAIEVEDFGIEIELDRDGLSSRHVLAGSGFEHALVADRYRLLRTRIRQRMKPRGWSKLGITSPGSKEGKSLTAINLAIATSRDTTGQVVLVDADLRRPSVANYLGFQPEKGLTEYLLEQADLEEIVYRPSHMPNLNVVPTIMNDTTLASKDSLGSERMRQLLDTFVTDNTMLIVDLPPVLVADDVLALAPLLDALLIVIRDGKTSIDELKQGNDLLSDFNLLGTVLNASEDNDQGVSGYYYQNGQRP